MNQGHTDRTDRILQDKILVCVACGEEFTFTAAAQEYFLDRGITEDPKRCKSCYMALKKEKRQKQKQRRYKPYRGRSDHRPPSHY